MPKNNQYVLGINEALNASAALFRNGELIAAVQEERLTRVKNFAGFPRKSIQYCLQTADITGSDLEIIALSYIDPYPHFMQTNGTERDDFAPKFLRLLRNSAPYVEYRIPQSRSFFNFGRKIYYTLFENKNQKLQIEEISNILNCTPEKIIRMDHHTSHAYAGYFSSQFSRKVPVLIFTNDGAGDFFSAKVFRAQNGILNEIAATPHTASLGLLYSAVTSYLGMKAHEDEYKVMGLAAYSENSQDVQSIKKIFQNLIWVEGLVFKSSLAQQLFGAYLEENLKHFRFDKIATALQLFFEDLMCLWIENSIASTSVNHVILSGGSFQNVKANQRVAQMKQVKNLFVMPSPGDETTAIGAGFWATTLCNQIPQPVTTLYLGPHFSENEIVTLLRKNKKISFHKFKKPQQKVAQLLANGEIVAHFCGKMEFGARALGNRSILADPRNFSALRFINKAIKQRDFWMPFAPTILYKKAYQYINISKNQQSSWMMMTYDTTAKGARVLAAAAHPYDQTVRAQLLQQTDNQQYYNLIVEFEKITGVAALLNTSFNLHGEPLVCTPADALSTFVRSGLTFMLMENFLIQKV